MSKFNIFLFICVVILSLTIIAQSITSIMNSNNKEDVNTEIETVLKKETEIETVIIEKDPTVLIDVDCICQYPELPTGCEAVSTAMVLNYYGDNTSESIFAAEWMKKGDGLYYVGTDLYGSDPNEVFLGDPFTDDGLCCFPNVIVNAVNDNSKVCKAEVLYEDSLADLCTKYIDNNQPVIVWASIAMKPTSGGVTWRTTTGLNYTWIIGEHCVVLVGYNENYYFFNDPQSGSVVAFEKEVSEKRFAELEKKAVLLTKKEA